MTKLSENGKVKIYLDFVNYLGETNESVVVAEFKNVNWALALTGKLSLQEIVDELNNIEDGSNEQNFTVYRYEEV